MGGGNGCKSAAKREKNQAKLAKAKGSQLGAVKAQAVSTTQHRHDDDTTPRARNTTTTMARVHELIVSRLPLFPSSSRLLPCLVVSSLLVLSQMRICKKCYTQYPYTAKEPELRTHCENKHPDFKFEQSFPDYGKEAPK